MARPAPTASTTEQVAVVIDGPGSTHLSRRNRPAAGPREVVVRLEGSGVCGSDLAAWQGRPWFDYPLAPGAPGHEGWGVVEEVGDEVASVAPGRRVAAVSYRAYALFDTCDAGAVVPVPDTLDGPFPAEAVGCAMNVFARSGISAGTTVAVVGVGFLGALLVQLASNAGATVIALSRRRFALDVARASGAAWAASWAGDTTRRAIEEQTAGDMCDVVVEAAGRQSTLDIAGSLVRERGRLVIAGYHQDAPRTVDMQSWNWRGIDVVNAHERRLEAYTSGIKRAIDAVVGGAIDLELLITHRFSLSDLAGALDASARRPEGFLKAVVET